MDQCACAVCTELNRVIQESEGLDFSDLRAVSQALSFEVREILIAQDRVAKGTAGPDDTTLVMQAARRCTATVFRRLPPPAELPVH